MARPGRCTPVAAALLLIVLTTGGARAADFAVDSALDAVDALPGDGICAALGGGCTVRAAIIEANQLSGADSISIPAGSYALSIAGADEDDGLTGDLDVLDAVVIRGAGAALTILDGAGLDTVLSLRPLGAGGAAAIIEIADLTLRGGSGSGVFVSGSAPDGVAISDCVVERNELDGVSVVGSVGVEIRRTGIVDNVASGVDLLGGETAPDPGVVVDHSLISDNGVGVEAQLGALRVTNSVLERNEDGGIIAAETQVVIEDSLIRANRSTGVLADGHVQISRTSVEDNTDGGVRCMDNADAEVAISDSTIARNSSALGVGGVTLLRVASATISSSTISGNSGANVGGLLISTIAIPGLVQDCTIAGNAGGRVGGVSPGAVGQPIALSRTLVAGNTAVSAPSDCGHLVESFEVLASSD